MPTISGGSSGGIPGVTVSGTPAASQALIATSSAAASWAYPPGFEIGYDQITSNVNIVSTTESAGTTVITCAAHTFDGAAVIAEFYSAAVGTPTPAVSFCTISLFEGSTQIAELATVRATNGAGPALIPVFARLRFTPTAGSHTYTVTAYTSSTTGAPNVGAGGGGTGAGGPAFIRFTKA